MAGEQSYTPDEHSVRLLPVTGSQPCISEQFLDFQVEEPNIIEVAILKHICAEGVKYLAELCGLCAERLQAMGSSLSAEVEHKQAANDCILWPDSPLEKAKYMHMQVRPNTDLLGARNK